MNDELLDSEPIQQVFGIKDLLEQIVIHLPYYKIDRIRCVNKFIYENLNDIHLKIMTKEIKKIENKIEESKRKILDFRKYCLDFNFYFDFDHNNYYDEQSFKKIISNSHQIWNIFFEDNLFRIGMIIPLKKEIESKKTKKKISFYNDEYKAYIYFKKSKMISQTKQHLFNKKFKNIIQKYICNKSIKLPDLNFTYFRRDLYLKWKYTNNFLWYTSYRMTAIECKNCMHYYQKNKMFLMFYLLEIYKLEEKISFKIKN